MTTFPTPPLSKITKAWSYLKRTPATNDPTTWLETGGADADRKAEDRFTSAAVQTVTEAQTILDAHNDAT